MQRILPLLCLAILIGGCTNHLQDNVVPVDETTGTSSTVHITASPQLTGLLWTITSGGSVSQRSGYDFTIDVQVTTTIRCDLPSGSTYSFSEWTGADASSGNIATMQPTTTARELQAILAPSAGG